MSAKQKLSPPHYRGLALPGILLAFLLACSPIPARADSLEDAARNLARKICATPHQKSVKINWQVSPELSGSFSESLKRAFLSQLSACGVAMGDNSDFLLLNLAVRATPSKVVLIASLADSGRSPQIRITEIQRNSLSVSNASSRTPRLQRKLLWQQERPLETAMEWYSPSTQEHFLFLVGQDSLVRLQFTNEVWTRLDSAGLPGADRPSPRGGGGSTFLYDHSEAEAKLELFISQPGPPFYQKRCEFTPAGSLSLICNDSYLGGKQLGIFSECGNILWFLETDSGDFAHRDRISCVSAEVAEAELPADEAASHSLEMAGPVLDMSAAVDSKAAIAVVRNLATGNYEVYRITLACGN